MFDNDTNLEMGGRMVSFVVANYGSISKKWSLPRQTSVMLSPHKLASVSSLLLIFDALFQKDKYHEDMAQPALIKYELLWILIMAHLTNTIMPLATKFIRDMGQMAPNIFLKNWGLTCSSDCGQYGKSHSMSALPPLLGKCHDIAFVHQGDITPDLKNSSDFTNIC